MKGIFIFKYPRLFNDEEDFKYEACIHNTLTS